MRISDWSSDVCSSDLIHRSTILPPQRIERDLSEACFVKFNLRAALVIGEPTARCVRFDPHPCNASDARRAAVLRQRYQHVEGIATEQVAALLREVSGRIEHGAGRSEEHTSELQSLMRISYAVFCLKKTKKK